MADDPLATWCRGLDPEEFPGALHHDETDRVPAVTMLDRSLIGEEPWPVCSTCFAAWRAALLEEARRVLTPPS